MLSRFVPERIRFYPKIPFLSISTYVYNYIYVADFSSRRISVTKLSLTPFLSTSHPWSLHHTTRITMCLLTCFAFSENPLFTTFIPRKSINPLYKKSLLKIERFSRIVGGMRIFPDRMAGISISILILRFFYLALNNNLL